MSGKKFYSIPKSLGEPQTLIPIFKTEVPFEHILDRLDNYRNAILRCFMGTKCLRDAEIKAESIPTSEPKLGLE